MTTRHATTVFDRTLNAPARRVFDAFAKAEARAIWAPPVPEINMVFEKADFRVGGRDLCRCGPGPAEGVTVETFYHAIDDGRRIVFTEVIGMPEAPEAVGLVTVEIAPQDDESNLTVTVQLTSVGAEDMTGEVESGWTSSLQNLERYLAA